MTKEEFYANSMPKDISLLRFQKKAADMNCFVSIFPSTRTCARLWWHWCRTEDLLLYVETVISGGSGVGKPIPSTWRSLPRFLVGHSMGGAITIRAAFLSRDRPIHVWAGLVLSGPCLVINPEEATPPLRFLAKTLSGIFPKLGITPGLGGIAVSRDPAVIESYVRTACMRASALAAAAAVGGGGGGVR